MQLFPEKEFSLSIVYSFCVSVQRKTAISFPFLINCMTVRAYVCRSLELVGNPIGLVSSLGIGVRDFFYEPAHALINR